MELNHHFGTVEVYKGGVLVHTHERFPLIKIAEIYTNWSYTTISTYRITKHDGSVEEVTL